MKKNKFEKNDVFIQARLNSTRFPKKILKTISNKTILQIIVERAKQIENIDKIVLVTGPEKLNSELFQEADRLGMQVFFGDEENVLDRFFQAGECYKPDNIIRITGDCPLLDFELISKGIDVFNSDEKIDLLTNTKKITYPHGFDFEIFTKRSLDKAWKEITENSKYHKKEFINPVDYIMNSGKFNIFNLENIVDQSHIRLTLDYQEDLIMISEIYEKLISNNNYFTSDEIIVFLEKNPHLLKINEKYEKV